MELTKNQRERSVFIDINNKYAPGGTPILVTNLTAINKKIYNVLTTPINSLPMEPDFGANLESFLQEPFDSITRGNIEASVLTALIEWVPEISVNPADISVVMDEAAQSFSVRVSYSIRNTNADGSIAINFSNE